MHNLKSVLTRTGFVHLLTICAVAYLLGASQAIAADKPNIILIYSDDVGLGDIGCFGGPFKTPHIDALAQSGLRFTQCYSTPLCGPSRCQTLTGRYPFRTGLLDNQSHQAIQPGSEIMIPTVMKRAGYVTASIGKWGQMSYGPVRWGFDESLMFPGSGRYWRDQTAIYRVNGEVRNLPEGKYLPDIMHTFLVDFITRHKDRPFFVYYPMSHVHGPIVRTPDSGQDKGEAALYADNVKYMDKLVGKLMAELDKLNLRQKTLVLFTGDNGTARFGPNMVNGQKLSGRKGTMQEGGSRVPLIANWKGTTPEGKVLNDLVDFSDFFTTFADLGGAKLPEGVPLDGHSFVPQLRGEKGTPREWIFVELDHKWYVREQGWKLNEGGELFDMTDAPFVEKLVPADTKDEGAMAARKRLQGVLDKLNPAGGKTTVAEPKKDGAKKGKKRRQQP